MPNTIEHIDYCPETDNIMNKIIHAGDMTYICHDIYHKLNNRICELQPYEDKRARIQNTGRLVWIADRFVDIDFSKLKDAIPYVVDGDRLMIIRDETRNDQCTVYSIYNTDSVPNIKYLGYEDPNTYPSCTAVQQYVANAVAMAERGLVSAINDIRSDNTIKIENLTKESNDLKNVVDSMNQMISNITEAIEKIQENISSIEEKIQKNIDDVKHAIDAIDTNTASIAAMGDTINDNTSSIANEVSRATQAETTINSNISAQSLRIDKCESDIEEIKSKH